MSFLTNNIIVYYLQSCDWIIPSVLCIKYTFQQLLLLYYGFSISLQVIPMYGSSSILWFCLCHVICVPLSSLHFARYLVKYGFLFTL